MQMKVDYRCLSSIEEEPRMKRKVVIKCGNHQLVLWSSGVGLADVIVDDELI